MVGRLPDLVLYLDSLFFLYDILKRTRLSDLLWWTCSTHTYSSNLVFKTSSSWEKWPRSVNASLNLFWFVKVFHACFSAFMENDAVVVACKGVESYKYFSVTSGQFKGTKPKNFFSSAIFNVNTWAQWKKMKHLTQQYPCHRYCYCYVPVTTDQHAKNLRVGFFLIGHKVSLISCTKKCHWATTFFCP